MKTVLLFLLPGFFILFHINLYAQEVICPGGDFYSNSYGSFSYTLGEPVIETFTGNENILTQGFQQSRLIVTTLNNPYESDITVTANPNPAKDLLKITIENAGDEHLTYKFFDSGGKLMFQEQFDPPATEIPCSALLPNTYFLKIYSGKKEIQALKIIKQ